MMAQRKTRKENPVLPISVKPKDQCLVSLGKRTALGEVGNKLAARPTQSKVTITKPTEARKPATDLQKAICKRIDSIKELKLKEESYSTKQLQDIEDPDAKDGDEPLLVSEYIKDVYLYLRELEVRHSIRPNHLENHKSTPHMRSVLVNWLAEVHISFKLLLETFHLAVGILDRYLQETQSVGRDTLQLVGTTALRIAAKYEEIYAPELDDYTYVCDYTFSKKQIHAMEMHICRKLKWEFGRPLSLHFLRRFSKVAGVKSEHHVLGKYLLELALLDYDLCAVTPSKQAAAATCLSISILNGYNSPEKAWSDALIVYGGYKYAEFKTVVLKMANVLLKMETSRFQAIRKKYMSANYLKISANPKLSGNFVKIWAGYGKMNQGSRSSGGK